jgi:hypothetical protein
MNLLSGLLVLAWWISGSLIIIHEMRHDEDVDLGYLLLASVLGIGGPLWFIMTLVRKSHRSPSVVFKKYSK